LDIVVPGYSVPIFADWNNDGKKDLIVGEGGNYEIPRIRVYPNVGTASEPSFSQFSYAEHSTGANITYPGDKCICRPLGLFPRLVRWDGDALKDLLVGHLDGTIMVYSNVGSAENPVFDDGTFLQVGQTSIDVGNVATPTIVDWNGDYRKDLVVGDEAGNIHLFLNEGTDEAPVFLNETLVQENGADLLVQQDYVPGSPSVGLGSSPEVLDLNGDGMKDLLSGGVAGQLLLYPNVGTDSAPVFSGHSLVQADGVNIEVDAVSGASPRSRPFVCDWTGDGNLDVLVGAGDGKVYLYQGVPEPTTLALLAVGMAALVRRCKRRRTN
jgi:hypothetical protein